MTIVWYFREVPLEPRGEEGACTRVRGRVRQSVGKERRFISSISDFAYAYSRTREGGGTRVPRRLSQLHNDRAGKTPGAYGIREAVARERRRKIKDPPRLELDQLIFGPGIERKKGWRILSPSLSLSRTISNKQSRELETKSSTTFFLGCRSVTSNRWHAVL